ncbi:MAG: single-stranded DNA-binding protein [Defluviitaleaceae bacterium]|nr:single-stranded DNA-binding protein [Defluviitaleaceae bacterium]
MMTITGFGRITKDLELKKGKESGCVYVNFSLAVNEVISGKQKVTYYECTAFGTEAERLVNAKAKKGSVIQVTGKLGTSEFTRDNGQLGYSLKINVHAWSYIPNGKKDTDSSKDTNNSNGQTPDQSTDEHHEDAGDTTCLDDEPF